MKCKQCGANIDDDSMFCPECGAKCGQEAHGQQENTMFCPNCGQKMAADSAFCPNCGTPIEGASSETKERKNLKKIFIPAAAVVVLAAGLGIGAKVFLSGSGRSDDDKIYNKEKLLYVKDDSLYMANLKKLKKEPVEYTDELRDSSGTYGYTGVMYGLSMGASFSKDGKYCFYPERRDVDGCFRLMRKKVGSKKDGEKVDSDVSYYSILDSGDVIYKKSNDSVYIWDGKEKTKLDSDVFGYYVSKEQNAIMWLVEEEANLYNLYYQKLGKKGEKEKLESGIDYIEGYNDDFSKIYFRKNEALYLVENQKEKKKLAGDVGSVVGMDADKGTFYFTSQSENKEVAADFVTDDISQADNSYYWDSMREDLKEREIVFDTKEMYYFNGKEKTLLTDKAEDIAFWVTGGVIFTQRDSDDLPTIRLSELSYAGEVERILNESEGSSRYYLAVGTELNELDSEQLISFRSNEDKKLIYALEGDGAYEDGRDLISINYGKGGEVKNVDEDVQFVEEIYDGTIYYYKDSDREGYSADLYCDGKMVLSDVAMGSLVSVPDSGKVVCITDGNGDKHRGTLTLLSGDKDVNLADDVSFYDVIGEKSIVMLTDYNFDRRRGDLKYYKGKECETVDSDVSGIYAIGNSHECP